MSKLFKRTLTRHDIHEVVAVERDRVAFTLVEAAAQVIELKRHLHGWSPRLRITVDDVVWHDVGGREEEQLFTSVKQLCWDIQDDKRAAHRRSCIDLANRVFGSCDL